MLTASTKGPAVRIDPPLRRRTADVLTEAHDRHERDRRLAAGWKRQQELLAREGRAAKWGTADV